MIALGLCAFVTVLILTRLYLPLGARLQHLDMPTGRSAHQRPVVSSGGLAIILGLLLTLLVFMWSAVVHLAARELGACAILAVLCLVGFADDRQNLAIGLRLGVFLLLGAMVCVLYLWPVVPPANPWWLFIVLVAAAALAFTWLLNLFNFMDGIDGIAALNCAVVALVLAVIGWRGDAPASFVGIATAVAGAYAAFLCFNWPPARVFMGDAGSLSAGFCLGWLGLWGAVDGYMHPLVWLVLMSPFLLDTGYTLVARLLRGERITQAHNQHIYQRLARHWRSHQRVDMALLALQLLWLVPLALAASAEAIPVSLALALAVLPQLFLMLFLMAKAAPFK